MKMRKTLIAVLTLILLICIPGHGKTDTAPPADLVIKNAKIITIDKENKRAEAVAVRGEFIIAAGTNKQITPFIKPGKTKVIDAKGRLVVPGFNDAHAHFRGMDPKTGSGKLLAYHFPDDCAE